VAGADGLVQLRAKHKDAGDRAKARGLAETPEEVEPTAE
jgi:hypothetical protein